MARANPEHAPRARGMGILARFTVSMTLALAVVMAAAGFLLYQAASTMAQNVQHATLKDTASLTDQNPPYQLSGDTAKRDEKTGVESVPITYGHSNDGRGWLYRVRKQQSQEATLTLIMPGTVERSDQALLGLVVATVLVVILVGALVSGWVSLKVSRPIEKVINDIREIARGHLRQLTVSHGSREVDLLARSINRMTMELEQAQEAEMELAVREREQDLANGVREALLPMATPLVDGYDLGSSHLNSRRFGGDFHDYIELEDGRVGALVCDVAGWGVPAALVGATARSYLRGQLLQGGDIAEALYRINRWLAQDLKRGMFVTAMYVLLDPGTGRLQVACAGHKIPLVRFCASDGKLRLIHPEGIALGFDGGGGAVFERSLDVRELSLDPGDRVVLANSGPVRLKNPEDVELGEQAFYSLLLRSAKLETGPLLKSLRKSLEAHAGEAGLSSDVSLVTIQRVPGEGV